MQDIFKSLIRSSICHISNSTYLVMQRDFQPELLLSYCPTPNMTDSTTNHFLTNYQEIHIEAVRLSADVIINRMVIWSLNAYIK